MPEKVAILREQLLPLPVSPGGRKDMIELTYQAERQFPRTVYIDPDHDSPEERVRVISEDLKKARAFVAPTIDLE